MRKRRTREQKVIAQLRRQLEQTDPPKDGVITLSVKPSQVYYAPSLQLPEAEIKRDLLKTMIIMLVIVVILGLVKYLQLKHLLVF